MIRQLPWRRLASFGGLQLFSAVAPVLVLPVLVRTIGTHGWVGLSIGYGIGAAAAILTSFAWPMTGPPRVAAAAEPEARGVYWESVVVRLVTFAVSGGLSMALAGVLAPGGSGVLAAAMALAVTSWGLTPSWYYVGVGKPRGILAFETLPRLAATLSSIPAIALTGSALWYPALLLATSAGCLVTATRSIGIGWRSGGRPTVVAGLGDRLRTSAALTLSALVGAGYTSLVVPLARLTDLGTQGLADLAASTRLRTMAQMGASAVTSGLQGWVAEPPGLEARIRRMRQGLLASTAGGVAGGLGLFLVTPFAGPLLFGSVAHVGWALSAVTAAAALPYAVTASLSFHVLTPLGLGRHVAWSRIAATAVGVPLLLLGASTWGAVGAASATLAAECVVLAWQASVARPHLVARPPS